MYPAFKRRIRRDYLLALDLANLRAWELALVTIARIQDQSRFFHFWR